MSQKYIATKNIEIHGARGYVPGDVVADDVVAEFGLEDSVSREGSKSAKEAAKPAEGLSQP